LDERPSARETIAFPEAELEVGIRRTSMGERSEGLPEPRGTSEEAEQGHVAAEDKRDTESQRYSAHEEQHAEEIRAAGEAWRMAQETARGVAEELRQANENLRQAAERAREAAEEARQSHETLQLAAEEIQSVAKELRQAAETLREVGKNHQRLVQEIRQTGQE
jgi:methyl-accepting chemotaxis protein